jgi:signal transduction histidine kinase
MGVGRDLFARKKDGSEFPVEVSLSNYNSSDGMHMMAFVVDITKRKEIEQAVMDQKELLEKTNQTIEELNNALEEKVNIRTEQLQDALNQIEASRDDLTKALSKEKELGDLKSRFVSMASHEFRTPLSTILSSASLLAKYTETAEQEKRHKHIQRIKESVSNLTGILNEFLSIGKIEDGKIEVRYTHFNIKEFLEGVVSEMQSNAKLGQRFFYKHQGEEWFELDMNLFRNICLNLLSNAIKFSTEKGIISIKSVVHDNGMELTVEDNGIGIAEIDQQHLFERFFRAGNVTNIQGTGLGLHIVSKYIELMNGSIHYKSELEKGTTFTIQFPINK